MADPESAQKVMNALNKQNVDGKEIIIELARLPGPRPGLYCIVVFNHE
jgi:hypothetical protein